MTTVETATGRTTPAAGIDSGNESTSGGTPYTRLTAGAMMRRAPITVRRDATLWTAWGLLYGSDERHLVVVDDYRRPVGVLDERLVALEWPAGPLAPHRQRVHELLRGRVTPRVQTGDDLATVARTMHIAGVDALPVTDRAGRLVGLVTTAEIVELVGGCR